MVKALRLLLFLLFCCQVSYSQSPIQKFWSLNQCQTLYGKLRTQIPTANAVYSIRKLSCTYTGFCMRVRIVGGTYNGSIGDVSFFGGRVLSPNSVVNIVSGTGVGTSVPFSTFYAGATTNAFVVIWYDQSGNNNHVVQNTAANQPLIVSNGALNLNNNYPSIQFVGNHANVNLPLTSALSLANGSLFGVCRVQTASNTCGIAQSNLYSYNLNTWNSTGRIGVTQYGVVDMPSTVSHVAVLDLVSWSKSSSNTFIEVNRRTSSGTANVNIPIGISQIYGNGFTGVVFHLSEVLIMGYANAAQRALIFTEQQKFFNTP